MNHNDAVKQMTVERYLLGELDPDARQEFEEHLFDCTECALDSRVAEAFIEEAKAQLSEIVPGRPEVKGAGGGNKNRTHWFWWSRPAFVVPVLVALVLVVCYQNLVTFPALRLAASLPTVVPVAPLTGATRGDARTVVVADSAHGIALPVDIPLDPALGAFASYSFELYSPERKLAWTAKIPAPTQATSSDVQFSIVMPGRMLESGVYSVSISGIRSNGDSMPIENYVVDIALSK
jgi:anti-sigma factor RsiW